MARLVFFSNTIATSVTPLLLCSTCLTSLLYMFRTIHQELFFYAYSEKIHKTKKKPWWRFFGKVVGLQHPYLLIWNPTMGVFLGIIEIIFWWVFHYYMESLQIIDWFYSSPLVIFQNMVYIFMQVIRNARHFIVFPFFYYHDQAKYSVFN